MSRFVPKADIAGLIYSITSSARARIAGGTLMPVMHRSN
jgi:hypothetical protein